MIPRPLAVWQSVEPNSFSDIFVFVEIRGFWNVELFLVNVQHGDIYKVTV